MNATPSPSDGVSIAQAKVERTRMELVAARGRVKESLDNEKLLEDRPDLLEKHQRINDHPCRKRRLGELEAERERERNRLLEQMKRERPFQHRADLVADRDYYEWLLHGVRGTNPRLEEMVISHRLRDKDKGIIQRRMEEN